MPSLPQAAVTAVEPRSVTILGSTGSVGCSTIDLISHNRDAFTVEALTANTRVDLLARQAREFGARRAVIADPQIFIMDEATSSVDTETEQAIQAGIDAVLRDRIAFVIAHRLSTIRAADVILVIDGGRIVERGTHEQLLARRGTYHRLYTKQFAREQVELAV